MQNKEYLRAAATAIARQIEENPVVLGIPVARHVKMTHQNGK